MEIHSNYQLLHENLLDVSHISFLHEGGFDTGAICKAEPKLEVSDNRIRVEREVEEVAVGAYAASFEIPEGTRVRRILRSESLAPNLNVVTNFFYELDTPDPKTYFHRSMFPITPKDDRSCHYFVAVSKGHGFTTLPDAVKQIVWDIFQSDKQACEAIQLSYDRLGDRTPDVSVRADLGAVRYRRIVTDLLEREGIALGTAKTKVLRTAETTG